MSAPIGHKANRGGQYNKNNQPMQPYYPDQDQPHLLQEPQLDELGQGGPVDFT